MIHTKDWVTVLYSAGKVFDNLQSSHLATEAFLLAGDTRGIASRADLQLLEDLQAAGGVAMQAKRERRKANADLVCSINAAMTRSAALHPGQLRKDAQRIGVRTAYGDHLPPALTVSAMQTLIDTITPIEHPDGATHLFVRLAAAQPFEDGNNARLS